MEAIQRLQGLGFTQD
jgi:uncharacterized UBP type Zn finger protein